MTIARDSHHDVHAGVEPDQDHAATGRRARRPRDPAGPLSPLRSDGSAALLCGRHSPPALSPPSSCMPAGSPRSVSRSSWLSLLAIGGLNRSRLSLVGARRPAADHPAVAGRRRLPGRRVGAARPGTCSWTCSSACCRPSDPAARAVRTPSSGAGAAAARSPTPRWWSAPAPRPSWWSTRSSRPPGVRTAGYRFRRLPAAGRDKICRCRCSASRRELTDVLVRRRRAR